MLKIPTNTAAGTGAAGAFNQVDPTQAFGNQVAQISGNPSVPQGLGGVAINDQSITHAIMGFGDSLNQMADRESALRVAQQHAELESSKIDYAKANQDLTEKSKKIAVDEGWTVDQQNDYYKNELEKITTASTDKFTDPAIAQKAKLEFKALSFNAETGYKNNVVEPARTAIITSIAEKTALDLSNLAAQATSINQLDEVRQKQKDFYDQPYMQAILPPDQRAAMSQKVNTQLENSFIEGVINRDDPTGQNLVYAKQLVNDPAALPNMDGMHKAELDGHIDRVIKARDEDIIRKKKEAEAEAKRKQGEYTDNMWINAKIGINAGKFGETELAKIAPSLMGSLEGKKKYLDLKTDIDQRNKAHDTEFATYNKVNMQLAGGLKIESQSDVDGWYKVARKTITSMPPTQQGQYLAAQFKSMGKLPTDYKNETEGMLKSDRPEVVAGAVDRLRYLQSQDQRVMQSFDTRTRIMIEQANTGVPITQYMKNRDALTNLSESDSTLRLSQYKVAVPEKAGTENDNIKFVKKNFSTFWGSNPTLENQVIGDFDHATKNYFIQTGDINVARKLALQDMQNKVGTTKADGSNRVMYNAPEVLYHQDPAIIKNQANKDMADLGLKEGDFRFFYGGISKNDQPYYLVRAKDDMGTYTKPVLTKDNQPAKWQFDLATTAEHVSAMSSYEAENQARAIKFAAGIEEDTQRQKRLDAARPYVNIYANSIFERKPSDAEKAADRQRLVTEKQANQDHLDAELVRARKATSK